jgi:hypothetical protein
MYLVYDSLWYVPVHIPTVFHSRLGLNITVLILKWIVRLNIIWHLFIWQVSTLVAQESSAFIFSRFLRIIGIYLHQTTLCHFLEVCNVKMNCTWWSVLRHQNIFQPENVEYCDFFDKHIATNISLFIKALKECVSLRVCAHIHMCLVVTFSDTNLVHLLHKILLQN